MPNFTIQKINTGRKEDSPDKNLAEDAAPKPIQNLQENAAPATDAF